MQLGGKNGCRISSDTVKGNLAQRKLFGVAQNEKEPQNNDAVQIDC